MRKFEAFSFNSLIGLVKVLAVIIAPKHVNMRIPDHDASVPGLGQNDI